MSGDVHALCQSMERLTTELRELIQSMRGKDDGKTDESSSTRSKRVPGWQAAPGATPGRAEASGGGGGVILSPSGIQRPHIPGAASNLSSAMSMLKSLADLAR